MNIQDLLLSLRVYTLLELAGMFGDTDEAQLGCLRRVNFKTSHG